MSVSTVVQIHGVHPFHRLFLNDRYQQIICMSIGLGNWVNIWRQLAESIGACFWTRWSTCKTQSALEGGGIPWAREENGRVKVMVGVWASGLTLKLDLDPMCSYISRAVQVRLISRLISLGTASYHAWILSVVLSRPVTVQLMLSPGKQRTKSLLLIQEVCQLSSHLRPHAS